MSTLRISLCILIYFSLGSASANEKRIFSWNMKEQSGDIKRISEIVERTNLLSENLSKTEINTSLINCLALQKVNSERKTINGSGNSEEFVRNLKEQLADLSEFTVYPPKKIRIQILNIDSDEYKNICKFSGGEKNFGLEAIWITLNQNMKKWEASTEYKNEVNANIAKVKRAEDDRLKAVALEESRIAKEFPYVARFTCTTNGYPVNFISCLYGGDSVNTEIEIKNGQEYKLYQGSEFSNKFPNDKGAKVVNLRSNYSIVAQNASSDLILGLKILDRKTGATLFEKQVSKFGVIKVRN